MVINPTNTFASTLTYHSCDDGTLGVVCVAGSVAEGGRYYYCDHCKTDLGDIEDKDDADADADADEE